MFASCSLQVAKNGWKNHKVWNHSKLDRNPDAHLGQCVAVLKEGAVVELLGALNFKDYCFGLIKYVIISSYESTWYPVWSVVSAALADCLSVKI